MEKFTIGERPDAAAELTRLFDYNGFAYSREGERFRLVFADRGRKWETVCVCRERAVLIYGIYPFPPRDRARALELCNSVNRQVLYGGMLLQEDAVIFRTCADLFDSYSAYEAIARALEYNANVLCEFWPEMSSCSQEPGAALPIRSGTPPRI